MISTRILDVTRADINEHLRECVAVLRNGGLVAFPTETVYGLGADASNESAVTKVFKAKNRPADNPLIVHIAGIEQLESIARAVPENARRLAERFWPGPLTLVVEHRGQFPDLVTAGLPTVAVRAPNHPVALSLIRTFDGGIVGPSANLSGKPSPTTAQHVYADLNGKVEIILDAGHTMIGVESTVVDVTDAQPTILRLGGLPKDEIERIIGPLQTTSLIQKLNRSPGTRYRHYAPLADIELIKEGDQKMINHLIEQYRRKTQSLGCIVHSLDIQGIDSSNVRVIRREDYARKLFELLRGFDELGVDVILVECIPEVGIGEAVMDRLRKASEKS
jgi:L-threonylcarbamoyladenylate synthase